jgi:hypothetical protein
MTLPQQAADAITTAAGWKTAVPDEHGVFHFRLEGDLDMDFLCPDGRTGILRGTLTTLPDAENEAELLLRRCAQRAVAVCKKRKSVLSVESGRLQLHRAVRLDKMTRDELREVLATEARDFLNDLAWWHNEVGNQKESAATTTSAFSFSGFGTNWSLGR